MVCSARQLLDSVGFFVRLVDAVVSDFDGGHCDDLPEIGRVGKNLLIARHGSVEDRLADDRFLCAECAAFVYAAVFECQNSCLEIAHNVFRGNCIDFLNSCKPLNLKARF